MPSSKNSPPPIPSPTSDNKQRSANLTPRVLVTGAAGFIGSSIVRRLLEKGILPVVFDNLSSGYRENLVPGVPFIEGDIRDRKALDKAAAGCRLIFHLAACVGNLRSSADPVTAAEVNVLGTVNVLEAARRNGIERVVFSSSAAVFGEPLALPVAEDHPQNPDTPYGAGKLAGEKMCLAYNRNFGMRNVCLRYFNVYGPNQRYDAYGNVIPVFADRVLRGEALTIYGDGEQTRDFVHVADVAKVSIDAVFADGAGGAFNVGSGASMSVNELARLLQQAAGVAVGTKYAPTRTGDVRHSLADIGAAKKAFGFNPQKCVRSGLAEYLAWVKRDRAAHSTNSGD